MSSFLLSRSFGLIQEVLVLSIILTLEAFGRMVDSIISNSETGAALKFLRVNPWALSGFKEFLMGLYYDKKAATVMKNFHQDEELVGHSPSCRYEK